MRTESESVSSRVVVKAPSYASRATAGQTLVSDAVLDVVGDVPVSFRDVGLVELKGVPRPVRLHEAVPA